MPARPSAPPRPPEIPVFWVTVAVSVLALIVGLLSAHSHGPDAPPPPAEVDASVSAIPYGSPTPAGYLGLSLEFSAVETYAGTDPSALNPVFLQLVRNLAPGQSPVLRVGGDSADWTWWPVPGVPRPPGVTYALDSRWTSVAAALTRALHARLILGLNLEADSATVANYEANSLLNGLGHNSVLAFQLGNEPELYASFPWYWISPGHGVTGRKSPYSFDDFLADFHRIATQLPPTALAGPTTGGPGWLPNLGRFLSAEPAVRLATVHRYPLQLCHTAKTSDRFPSVANLLAPTAAGRFAESFAPAVAAAHARGVGLRIDELNSVSCGADAAVSQTFASALWSLDTLFALRRVGVDGVQMHTFPGAGYELFPTRRRGNEWSASVSPEYYGLLMFASAAPPGSRLLRLAAPAVDGLRLWATSAPDHHIRVVLINKSATHAITVHLRVAGVTGRAGLERLAAPSAEASRGVTLNGESFGATTPTGRLVGRPAGLSVAPLSGRYTVSLPAASAAMLVADATGAAA